MKRYFLGESAICWPLGNTISLECSARVLRVYRALKALQSEAKLDVLDVVPSYTAIAVYFDAVGADIQLIEDCVQAVIDDDERITAVDGAAQGKKAVFPIHYDGQDIERVAAHNGLCREEVIALHVNATYTVAMIGFLPHFPYLIGLDKKLHTPRLDAPRTRVPAGSIAIGGQQTGVYPSESPGGWNIIGQMDPQLLVSLEPGDRVVFRER